MFWTRDGLFVKKRSNIFSCLDYELAIGVCYRNPSACDIEEENLHDCIKLACDRYKNIIIVGDFSQRVVDQWNRLPTTTVCAETINRFKNQILTQCYGNTRALYKPT